MTRFVTPIAALSLLLLGACTNPVDDSQNILVAPKATGSCTELLSEGEWYRFTKLAVTDLSGGQAAVIDNLNDLWGADIAKRELNIMVEVVEIGSKDMTLRMVSGARAGTGDDPPICLIQETAVALTMAITEEGLGDSEATSMNIYAGSMESPKTCATNDRPIHSIPVSKAVVQDVGCNVDEGLVGGNVVGAIGRAALETTCSCLTIGSPLLSEEACGALDTSGESTEADPCGSCKGVKTDGSEVVYQNLITLLNLLNGGELEWSETDDDGGEAAKVTSEFQARKYDDVPQPCE